MNTLSLKKREWTEKDFDQMNWHDCKIYCILFGKNKYEISFDIDYLETWLSPNEADRTFKFWILPATLVFRNVYQLSLDSFQTEIVIDQITRGNPTLPKNSKFIHEQLEYEWTIETKSGAIDFKSVGFTQYARRNPILSNNQTIDLAQRGGVSFDITTV